MLQPPPSLCRRGLNYLILVNDSCSERRVTQKAKKSTNHRGCQPCPVGQRQTVCSQTDRRTDIQIASQTQTDRQATSDKQTDRQTDRQQSPVPRSSCGHVIRCRRRLRPLSRPAIDCSNQLLGSGSLLRSRRAGGEGRGHRAQSARRPAGQTGRHRHREAQ